MEGSLRGGAMDNLILLLVTWIPVAGIVLALCIGPDEGQTAKPASS
jgi:hypothetical protein